MADPASILLVEDDSSTRTVLTALLEEETYRVIACQNAEEALGHLMSEDAVQIVISDLNLPDGSGLQILWTLKKINPDTAFILITGQATLETAIEAVNQGAFAYHVKPLDMDALNHSVRNALREQQLRAENRDLLEKVHRARVELEVKNRELERASSGKSLILSQVSHERKTPLTNILCYTDRLLLHQDTVGELGERQRRYLDTVRENASRLNALIDDLLDVSRIESGSLELTPTVLDAGFEIAGALGLMEEQIVEKRIDLVTHIGPNLTVWADRLRLSQVICNLLSNACKYSPAGTTVTVSAEVSGTVVKITVSDTGVGVSETELSRLFTKFFRGDNGSNREVSGTGLGLFITRHIVEGHGGKIWIESEVDKGTVVCVTLPRPDGEEVGSGTQDHKNIAVKR